MLHMLAGLHVNESKVKSTAMKRMHAVKKASEAGEQWFYRTGLLFGCNLTWCIIISWHWHLIGRTWISDTSTWSIWNKNQAKKQKQPIFHHCHLDRSIARLRRKQPINKDASGQWDFFVSFCFLRNVCDCSEQRKEKKNLSMDHTGWEGAGLCGYRGGATTWPADEKNEVKRVSRWRSWSHAVNRRFSLGLSHMRLFSQIKHASGSSEEGEEVRTPTLQQYESECLMVEGYKVVITLLPTSSFILQPTAETHQHHRQESQK